MQRSTKAKGLWSPKFGPIFENYSGHFISSGPYDKVKT